jgi:hypothetical protein
VLEPGQAGVVRSGAVVRRSGDQQRQNGDEPQTRRQAGRLGDCPDDRRTDEETKVAERRRRADALGRSRAVFGGRHEQDRDDVGQPEAHQSEAGDDRSRLADQEPYSQTHRSNPGSASHQRNGAGPGVDAVSRKAADRHGDGERAESEGGERARSCEVVAQ